MLFFCMYRKILNKSHNLVLRVIWSFVRSKKIYFNFIWRLNAIRTFLIKTITDLKKKINTRIKLYTKSYFSI